TLDEAVIFRPPCKEFENFFLLSGKTPYKAATTAARAREDFTGQAVTIPTLEEIEEKIDELSGMNDLREVVEPQWLVRWAGEDGIHDAGQLRQGQQAFQKLWSDPTWRRHCCPGKEVLKRLRQWLKETHKLNLSLRHLVEA